MAVDFAALAEKARKELAGIQARQELLKQVLETEQRMKDLAFKLAQESEGSQSQAPARSFKLGEKEMFYDLIVKEILEEYGTANSKMFMERFEKEGVPMTRAAMYSYYQRATEKGKIHPNPNKRGYYQLGPAPK